MRWQRPKYLSIPCSLRAVVLLLTIACSSESDARPSGQRLTVSADVRSDTTHILLSHSPNGAAAGEVEIENVAPDLLIGNRLDGFGHLSDVTTAADGRIFASDLTAKTVWVFNREGQRIDSIGRSGRGPGELTDPIAITSFGDYLAVMQTSVPRFSVFDLDGRFVGSSPPDQLSDADWQMFYFRGELVGNDRPYQTTGEDWTRRLIPADTGTFGFQVQDNERVAMTLGREFSYDSPPVHLVRFDSTGDLVDTLGGGAAPPSRSLGLVLGTPTFDQPVFARRPLWAAGDGWWASGSGRRSEVTITSPASSMRTMVVEWAPEPRPLSDLERIDAAKWLQRAMQRHWPNAQEFDREWSRKSGREREAWWRRIHRDFMFPDTVPQLTAIYGAGDCLWMAGFNSSDYADGTALTWIGINLRTQVPLAVGLRGQGNRVRHFDRRHAFVSFRDEVGVHYVERYPIPESLGC